MSFFAPYMLWGALAAGIPIAIHFLFRSRYRNIPWAAMTFLLQSIQETTRRLRFQELLLLCLRVAILLLLALALARPSSRAGGRGTGDAVDAVLLIDVSYSMDAREGGTTRLDLAKAAARSVLDRLPPHSTARIITVADRATDLGPAQQGDIAQALQIVAGISISQSATDFKPGAEEALAAIGRGTSANREVYLFSDLQKSGWERQSSALIGLWRSIHERAALTLVRCGTTSPRNVAVADIVPHTGVPRAGERIGFSVLVRNTGSEPLRDLTVSLASAGGPRESQPIQVIPPGETRTITLTTQFDKPGMHVISAEVGPDDLAADNRLDLVVQVRDQVRVLVVDGAIDEREPEKSASYFLLHALVPVREADRPKYWFQPRLVPPDRATPALLGDKDLCILVNVPTEDDRARGIRGMTPEFADGLARYVRGGKPLWIIPGDKLFADAYNRVLGSRGLLPLELKRIRTLAENAEVGIDRSAIRDSAFWRLREDEAYQALGRIKTRRFVESVAVGARDPVLLRFSDGQPLLAAETVGSGQVMLMSTSVDPAWTDWPLWLGQFVPFVDMAVNRLLQTAAQDHNGTVGEPIRFVVPESEAAQSFVVHRPDGQSRRLGLPEPVDGRMTLITNETAWAGVYRIGRAGEPAEAGVPFAMRCDASETADMTALTDSEINDRLGFAPAHVAAANLGADPGVAERLRREWTPSLLWIVLIAAVAEMALAWWCGQAR